MRSSVLLAALLLAGSCLRSGFGGVTAADSGGAAARDAAPLCSWGPFGAPVPVTEVNSPDTDWVPSISSDGLTLYLGSARPPSLAEDIWVARRAEVTSPFDAPTLLATAGVNTAANERSPALSADGLEFYFDRTAVGLLVARRSSPLADFDAPTVLLGDGYGAAPSLDGLTLYYTTGTETSERLAIAKRPDRASPFVFQRLITELNSMAADGWPSPSSDGLELYFESHRTGTPRIWVARRMREDAAFDPPQLVNVTVLGGESDPAISADGSLLYFATRTASRQYEIYVTRRTCQ